MWIHRRVYCGKELECCSICFIPLVLSLLIVYAFSSDLLPQVCQGNARGSKSRSLEPKIECGHYILKLFGEIVLLSVM